MEPRSCKFSDTNNGCNAMYSRKEVLRAQSPPLARHALATSSTSIPFCDLDLLEHIKVGSFYEIDHSKLPLKIPEQLCSIRVVVVSEKTRLNVSLRFPSIHSLRTHISDGKEGKPDGKQVPALDEKYVMGKDLASEVLFRRVLAQELAEHRNSWSFWAAPSSSSNRNSNPDFGSAVSKKGSCLSEIKFSGMVQWGKRRQVRFLGKHEENKQELSSSAGSEDEAEKEEDVRCSEEEVEEEDVKVEEEVLEVKNTRSSKRKLPAKNTSTAILKRRKCQQQNQISYNRSKKNSGKNNVERWSATRYKLAEENMLKIMKAKGAVFGKPILRPALRSEARKLIGDTGLLDHLLKHMAGKLAPGGAERFRRRHNADGAMEYWLESADLIEIRKKAGVQDTYWTPPPGWKLGDNPTQDPVCGRELKALREEMVKMKRDMQVMSKKEEQDSVYVKELEALREEMAKLKEDLQKIVSKKQADELASVTNLDSTIIDLQWGQGSSSSLLPLKKRHMELVNRKTKIEEHLMQISGYLSVMEEQMGMLKPSEQIVPELKEPPPLLIGYPTSPSDTEMEREGMKQNSKSFVSTSGDEEGQEENQGEDKATKIQRLKSGFRICKPQGSFLWPNMTPFPQIMVQLDDPFEVPTPPSASSSTTAPPLLFHSLQPLQCGPSPVSPPVKPLAEKRPVKPATLSSVSKGSLSTFPPPPPETPNSQSTTTTDFSLINLNEVPIDHLNTDTLTYKRKQQN